MKTLFRAAGLPVMAAVLLSACGGGSGTAGVPPTVFKIEPGEDSTGRTANEQVVDAVVAAIPGDTIEFACGFYDLTDTILISNTEDITIKGCGKDETVLSFRNMTTGQVGILGVNTHGLWISDLTVADTAGNGFELRNVDHGTLNRVRAYWSSGGGREATAGITADNYTDGRLDVKCTKPATLDPRTPENSGRDETKSPDYTVSDRAGRYGIYPVASRNILIDNSESIGASDAGIYVGQTTTAIIRNSRAAFNVFGFEIENVIGGEYHDNIAECNTGGFLVYDLDGNLRQYGDRTRMYHNISRMNNTYNFTQGGFVANVPPGSGMITLSYDRIDIFENEFRDNNTAGIIHTSYAIFGSAAPTEKRIDFYSEGVHIWKNKFSNNGNALPIPRTVDVIGGDITDPETLNQLFENQGPSPDTARLLPALVGTKGEAGCKLPQNLIACAKAPPANPAYANAAHGFRGGHIVWDGLMDTLDADCEYPTMANGEPVPKDERGKPQHTNEDQPTCHYNAYKFAKTAPRARITPDWWFSCIDSDNEFSNDSIAFANFHGTRGLNAVIAMSEGREPTADEMAELPDFPASLDLAPHDCVARYGKNLPPLPEIVIPAFKRLYNTDAAPTPEQVKALCEKTVPAGQVNFDAAPVDCPRLDQYHLFSNPEDPASTPNSSGGDADVNNQGMPFVLNTKLFSDYAVKYRVLFMPTGTKALYKDAEDGGPNATIIFPVGTIIAKTFAFRNETTNTENVVETRLLIKRINNAAKDVRWDGVSYIWKTGSDGKRYAELSPSGGTASVSWDFHDSDVPATHLTGSAPGYQIPTSKQCLNCHSREDSEPGNAPIGLKIRNLNRAYKSESSRTTGQSEMAGLKGVNQIAYMCDQGRLMRNCPENLGVANGIAANVERLPIWNKVGDSGKSGQEDLEARARAYLEVNCQHCHNVRGFAASTGLYLNTAGLVDLSHGMCKSPTATGREGSNGLSYDIVPANASHSIIPFRISPDAVNPAAKMPPLARSVVHQEGYELIRDWIDSIVANSTKYPNSEKCAGQ